jgi:O-antigen ligase
MFYAAVFALGFVGYPLLSAILGAFDAYARIFSIIFRAFMLLGSLFLIYLAAQRVPRKEWGGFVVVAFCALWVMLLARFAWDSSFVTIPLPLPWFELLLQMVGTALIPTIALFQAPSERAFDIARRITLFGGVIAGLFLVVAVIRIVIESDSLAAFARLGTQELNSITLGHIGTTVVIVALLGRPLPRAGSQFVRVLDSLPVRLTAGLIGGFLAIASASKGPIVALICAMTVWQVARIAQAGSARAVFVAIVRLGLVFAAMVALAIFLALFAQVTVIDRFVDFGTTTDYSTNERMIVWTNAMLSFEGSPWWGSSFVEIKGRFYPHNLFLEVLMAIGIPGFLSLLALLLPMARVGIRLLFTRHDWVGLLLGQQFLGMMFSGSVYFSSQFWCAAAAALAIDRLLARQAASPKIEPVPLQAAGAH